jgi:hypothetical protein
MQEVDIEEVVNKVKKAFSSMSRDYRLRSDKAYFE